MLSRRKFTLFSSLSFLTSGSAAFAQTQSGGTDLPTCQPVDRVMGQWDLNASVHQFTGEEVPNQTLTYKSLAENPLYLKSGDTWQQVNAVGRLEVRLTSEIGERKRMIPVELKVPNSYVDAQGRNAPLITLAGTEEKPKLTVEYQVDVIRNDTREVFRAGSAEMQFQRDAATHTLRVLLPVGLLRASDGVLSFSFLLPGDVRIGATADLAGLNAAHRFAAAEVEKIMAEVNAGTCKPRTGGCFVVTAADLAQRGRDGRAVDLDLILAGRDRLMLQLPQYREAALYYYRTSPELAQRLSQSNRGMEIFDRFLSHWVRPGEWLMKRGWTRAGFLVLGLGIELLYRRHGQGAGLEPPSAYVPGGWAVTHGPVRSGRDLTPPSPAV